MGGGILTKRQMTVRTQRKRVTKRPEERREELLDAAARVFSEKSVARTTVSDITEAAGVAKGTFYLYFDSKEHLLGALKERFVDQMLDRAASLYERVGKDDWWALVDETVTSFADFMVENRDLCHVMVQEGVTPETSPQFAECERRIEEMFAAGIRAGVEAGVFQVADPELASRFLRSAIDGAMVHAILYEEDFDRDRFTAAARELVHKTLAP
jgi:AcrR family transcriptional regulator